MVENGVFEAVPVTEVPKWAKIMSSIWNMKKKLNGVYQARVTARGFEQLDGQHYKKDKVSAPVITNMTIQVIMVLTVMTG